MAQSGRWSGWSPWGICSVTCGAGIKRRTRHCIYGNCAGTYRDSSTCDQGACSDSTATWGGKQDLENLSQITQAVSSLVTTQPDYTIKSTVDGANTLGSTTSYDLKLTKSFQISLTTMKLVDSSNGSVNFLSVDISTTPKTFGLLPNRKKNYRRFWLFSNGTFSRSEQIDPEFLNFLKNIS